MNVNTRPGYVCLECGGDLTAKGKFCGACRDVVWERRRRDKRAAAKLTKAVATIPAVMPERSKEDRHER